MMTVEKTLESRDRKFRIQIQASINAKSFDFQIRMKVRTESLRTDGSKNRADLILPHSDGNPVLMVWLDTFGRFSEVEDKDK